MVVRFIYFWQLLLQRIESLNLNPTIKDGLIPKALEITKYIVDKVNGEIPVQMYNSGGPMDIASMVLYDTELFTALYTHPKQVHKLMDACTNLFIEFYKAQQEFFPELAMTFADDMYIPGGDSILCGEDWLAAISPETAMEFEVPYINRISEEFGGIALHSCGTLDHQFEMLKKEVKNLRWFYFNAGTISFKVAVETCKGTDVVLMPRLDVNKPNRFESRLDYTKKLLSMKTDDITVYLIISSPEDPSLPDEEDSENASKEILAYIKKMMKS